MNELCKTCEGTGYVPVEQGEGLALCPKCQVMKTVRPIEWVMEMRTRAEKAEARVRELQEALQAAHDALACGEPSKDNGYFDLEGWAEVLDTVTTALAAPDPEAAAGGGKES